VPVGIGSTKISVLYLLIVFKHAQLNESNRIESNRIESNQSVEESINQSIFPFDALDRNIREVRKKKKWAVTNRGKQTKQNVLYVYQTGKVGNRRVGSSGWCVQERNVLV